MQRIFLSRVQSLSQSSGTSWAGDEYLANELRCTVPYVRKLRKGLEDVGYLERSGYGYGRKLIVNLTPKEVPVGTSSNRNKYLQEQVPTVSQEVPIVTKEVPTVSQEVPTGAHIEEYNKEYKEESIEERERRIIKRLIEEKEARERGEEVPQAVEAIPVPATIRPARGAARPAVVSNKAQPFDVEEVIDYFLELEDTPEEAANFYDYWTSAGWRRKSGPIKDWKATARTWVRSPYRKPKPKTVIDTARAVMEDFLNNPR